MAPPNIRDLVGDIREALERFPRETLVEILTYVFKEYVVEGPAPIAAAPATMRDDLEGQTFADVIRALQLRLDLPELGLFEVQGDRVTVKIGGRPLPIEAAGSRAEPLPPAIAQPPMPMETPARGITTASVSLPTARPAGGSPGSSREEIPLTGTPGPRAVPVGAQPPAPAAAPAAPTSPSRVAPAAKPAAAPADDVKPDSTDRFGKLEID
jgi:hypothetical protein